ncbi:hypothetical protein CFP65_7611 [Kitasatospora sp. MMS16-BH015]|uniref:hypothetical protein n=1 Tax=Kitasatospora sp. MMS16-BH015 TaxID=2018025 RepID=UPI000CA3201E|nr:hypothetical protein [Kitasatospora sp. MMS16-BH015]AUG82182.1 hypothetical protein CFP65_7611 [Kitasatospora sp. MMS16-BH015]
MRIADGPSGRGGVDAAGTGGFLDRGAGTGRAETALALAFRRIAIALVLLALGLTLSLFHHPRPVYAPPVVLALAAVAGLGWSIAVRTPAAGPAARPKDGRLKGGRPADGHPAEVPAGHPQPPARLPLPRSGVGWRHRTYLATLLLLAIAVLATLPSNAEDGRYRAFQRAGAAVTQGRIAQRPEHQKTVDHSGGKGQQRYQHSTADLVVALPGRDGRSELVKVRGASADTIFSRGGTVTVLYAPGAPWLGGVVDDSEDLSAYLPGLFRPPAAPVAALLGVYGFVMFGWIFTVLNHRGRAKAKVVRADSAAGAVPAVRAEVVAAVREDTTGPGNRPGTAAVSSRHWLELRSGATTVQLALADPHSGPFLAERLAGRPGWLVSARRWRLIKDEQPLAFVTDDGEVVWGAIRGYDAGFDRLFGVNRDGGRRSEEREPQPTDATRPTRLAPRVVHPGWATDGLTALLLALTLVATAPTLLTASRPFDHPFSYGAPLLVAALAGHALAWQYRTRRLRWTVRTAEAY